MLKQANAAPLLKDVKCDSDIIQESQEGGRATLAQSSSLWVVDAIRRRHTQTGRMIGLLSPRHMPINELFTRGRARVSSQSEPRIHTPEI